MVSLITPQALGYVRSRATRMMTHTCKVERVTKATYDETSLIATPGAKTIIYSGVCRIWSISGSAFVVVGETDVMMQNTQLSIPWDVDPIPQHNDEVTVLTADDDDSLVGKKFQIQDSGKSGALRATRRFTVISMEKTG
jgi:hypothetical protein